MKKPRHHIGVRYKGSRSSVLVQSPNCPRCKQKMVALAVHPKVPIDRYLCPTCGFRRNTL